MAITDVAARTAKKPGSFGGLSACIYLAKAREKRDELRLLLPEGISSNAKK
ncbi:hypothetical protein [Enterobacter ludwigii]